MVYLFSVFGFDIGELAGVNIRYTFMSAIILIILIVGLLARYVKIK
jgi:hypothetical protein